MTFVISVRYAPTILKLQIRPYRSKIADTPLKFEEDLLECLTKLQICPYKSQYQQISSFVPCQKISSLGPLFTDL